MSVRVDPILYNGHGKIVRSYFDQLGLKLEDDGKLYNAYGIVRGEVSGFEYDFLCYRLKVFAKLHREVKDLDGHHMVAKWGPLVDWSCMTPEQADTLIPLDFVIDKEWIRDAKIY
jgi:hypothetical protein